MIRRVKDDTSSLYVQRDSISLHSRVSQCTDTLSNISKTFVFDHQLFVSKVYERVHERVLRASPNTTVKTLRRQKYNVESVPDLPKVPAEYPQQSERRTESESVDSGLEGDSFGFDRKLYISKVDGRALTGSLKNTIEVLRHKTKFAVDLPSFSYAKSYADDRQMRNSQFIDRKLQREAIGLYRKCRVLVLGDHECGQVFLKQTKIFPANCFTTEELQGYKAVVRDDVQHLMNAVNRVLEQSHVELDDTTKGYAQVLSRELTTASTGDSAISIKAAEAMQRLWTSEQFSMLLQSADFCLPSSAE